MKAVKTIINALKSLVLFNCAFPHYQLFAIRPVVNATKSQLDKKDTANCQ